MKDILLLELCIVTRIVFVNTISVIFVDLNDFLNDPLLLTKTMVDETTV